MAEGLDCESSINGFESRISPERKRMLFRRVKVCDLCKKYARIPGATICVQCFKKIRM